ncbi:hypothetical protein McpAg1_16010 [Methanocorpusculaceae archaeon Ag1]|uniref:Zinc-ribbon 15 domain-containing protein n=1 Tax=Methanorbis furvi TaxID=3028299 RepID=A0AAE4MF55_9EURY|nr:hypothetical protein [Methanocorpusculaceae archaeon Ag1]
MIIWFTRHYERILSEDVSHRNCTHCHNNVNYKFIRQRTWYFILVFFIIPIFVFPISTKYRIDCPICHAYYEVGKSDVRQWLKEQKEIEKILKN